MAVCAGCNSGNDSATRRRPTAAKPAAVATAPADRKYLLERVDDAAVAQLYADGFARCRCDEKMLIWHLYQAALAGPRHLLRPALRAQPRDARRARGDHHAPGGRRSADARRDPALHQAVLDQHRALQQPDRAEVRAEVHAGGLRRGGAGGRRRAARRSRSRPARRSTRCWSACSRCSSTSRSTRSSRTRRRARARTSSRRAPTTSTSA